MKATIGILQFPGSNCDADCADTLSRHFQIKSQYIWHTEKTLPNVSGIVIPGGFSYGDYLRSGALAAHSVCMQAVREFAARGGPVFGICNGFQILTETKLLPGALIGNSGGSFRCEYIHVKPTTNGYLGQLMPPHQKAWSMPIAHGEGRYVIDEEGLEELRQQGQIALQYTDANGAVDAVGNPNGSMDNIAGVTSRDGRIVGMMPHPERATDTIMGGSCDGLNLWRHFLTMAG